MRWCGEVVFSATCKARGRANDCISYVGQKKLAYLLCICSISVASIASNEIGWMPRNRGRVPTEIDREKLLCKKASGEGRGSCLVGSIHGNLHERRLG